MERSQLTAPLYWFVFGPHLVGRVNETDMPVQGDSICLDKYDTGRGRGELWERVAER